jgi:hypothetical protein
MLHKAVTWTELSYLLGTAVSARGATFGKSRIQLLHNGLDEPRCRSASYVPFSPAQKSASISTSSARFTRSSVQPRGVLNALDVAPATTASVPAKAWE